MSADFFKFAADNARREFTTRCDVLGPERFWLHCEKLEIGAHCSFDLDFGSLDEAREMAEQLADDGDADSVTLTARFLRLDATYTKADGWDGESAAYVAYLKGEQPDPRD